MTPPAFSAEEVDPAEYVEVFRTNRSRTCRRRALVLSAMGIPHSVEGGGGIFSLLVSRADEARAREQLALYESENRNWNRGREALVLHPIGAAGVAAYAILLCAGYVLSHGQDGSRWLDAGRTDSDAMRAGEWWRAATALFLHADLSHLAGNLLFGAMFGLLLTQLFGVGLAWATGLATGIAGNVLNALVQADHRSIGASTAVFGMLGALSAFRWAKRRHFPAAERWMPLGIGAVLLGWFGVSADEQTDVLAHLFGFGSGLVAGVSYGLLERRLRAGLAAQVLAGLAAVGAVVGAWLVALSR
jgi:membrane associated rhomboid family serine protease